MADAIRASVSKISRLERGQSPAKTRDVMDQRRIPGSSWSAADLVKPLAGI
ncbi:hypothetical protein [Streptomyces sp. NPDC057966]|uniref:hypothetical protein n=1 Tax=Streptomyces sp. NPDC057966 TaxID=3346292 RepID=UPI0036EBBBB5